MRYGVRMGLTVAGACFYSGSDELTDIHCNEREQSYD
jgi:hypothetical protein